MGFLSRFKVQGNFLLLCSSTNFVGYSNTPWKSTIGWGSILVGGFNPFEKYSSKWEASPNRGENKNYFKPPPRSIRLKELEVFWHKHWRISFSLPCIFVLSGLHGSFPRKLGDTMPMGMEHLPTKIFPVVLLQKPKVGSSISFCEDMNEWNLSFVLVKIIHLIILVDKQRGF